jgi:hypothetical protein
MKDKKVLPWSLEDMLKFYADGFVNISMLLARTKQTLEVLKVTGESL